MHDVIRDMALWLACDNGKKKNNILVQEEAKKFAKWKEAKRIYLNGNDFDKDQTQNPFCPNLLTLLFRKASWNRFPSEFSHSMQVLDLSECDLNTLPGEIGSLVNLHYLNLSYTRIWKLPYEVGNLINLRSLLLDFTDELRYISGDVVSRLLSLQIFSKLANPYYLRDGNFYLQGSLMEKLDCLPYLSDVCLTLCSNECVQKLLNSSKLLQCIRQLSLFPCARSIEITSSAIRKMEHLESLEISSSDLEKMEVYVDRTITRHDYFDNLHHLHVWLCPLKDVSWLVYAPSLQILSLCLCDMDAVIRGDSGSVEIEESSAIFSSLTDLILEKMPELKYIHRGVLTFPCLTKVYIFGCPKLRRLPLDSRSAVNSLKEIRGEKDWWEGLHWDDEAAKHMFDLKFAEGYPLVCVSFFPVMIFNSWISIYISF
ncbi:hypothetical protein K2173_022256 [Erythroxylum novogranatense]|uniref:Disease resistance R13L4/SHOC-2-like LRR domain-containing protein n=1 Tax=Erythroxylum novogranatense TaxID=1862640 RepID=A0AAV8STP6_9ROSI|nr:hypothetical protein K2173_022256 [Erythroxylum novogranatense]